MKKGVVAAIVAIFSISDFFSSGWRDFVPNDVAEKLESDEICRNVFFKTPATLSLTPSAAAEKRLAEKFAAENEVRHPAFACETLWLVKIDGSVSTQRISQILRSFSSLSGVEYYSHRRKGMRVLYEDCYAVSDSDGGKKIPDPVDGDADGRVFRVMMQDSTFGKHYYRYDFFQDADSVSFVSRNLDALNLALFRILAPEKMSVSLSARNAGDAILLYVVFSADCSIVKAIEGTITASFLSRIDMLFDWFKKQLVLQ